MNLRPGKNSVKYVLETEDDQEISCTTDLYFFKSDTKIVVSDIDGTITKSDVLGQLMPIMGQDWTHANITELYHNIAKNGYQMVYLTSRAIGQSEITKNYIQSIKQNGFVLPPGPLIMSPDRLYHSFKREVILRRPEVFKIPALRDLASIFLPDEKQPMFAGFGNRDTDAISYRAVAISKSRIFIVNPESEIYQLNSIYKWTYSKINELVDTVFPPLVKPN